MFTARRKIQKAKGVDPTEFEDTVAQVRGSPLLFPQLLFPIRTGLGVVTRLISCRLSSIWRMATRSSRAT
jgi:hypothetical protein